MKTHHVVLLAIASCLALNSNAKANLSGSDNFNSGTLSANWGSSFTSGTGNPTLTETGSVLEFTNTTPSGSSNSDFRVLPWGANQGDVLSGWAAQVDVNLSDFGSIPLNQNVSIGLFAGKAGSETTNGLTIALRQDNSGRSFRASFIDGSNQAPNSTASLSAAVLLSWFPGSARLNAYYDADGATGGYIWSQLQSFDVSSWSMTATDKFTLGLIGSSKVQAVVSGQASLDNFLAQPVSVPEPSTFALLGVAAVGLFALRRKKPRAL